MVKALAAAGTSSGENRHKMSKLPKRANNFQDLDRDIKGWYNHGPVKQFIVIFFVWLILFLLFANGSLVNPDGIAHYAYLRSLLFDRDLLFFNEYTQTGFQPGAAYLTSTGHLSNIWSIGPAVLWLPFVYVGHFFSYLLNWFGCSHTHDGYSMPYIAYGIKLGSGLTGLCAILVLYLLGKRVSGTKDMYPSLLFLFGTPLLFYTFFWSDLSHVHSVLAVALFLYVQITGKDKADPWYWACSGCLFGIMILTREQNVGFFVFVLYDLYTLLKDGHPKSRVLKNLGLWSIACLVLFSPQLLAWKVILGSFWAAPKSANMDWGSFRVLSSLFSTYHGLFTWTPLFFFSLFGIIFLFRENRHFSLLLLVSFSFQVIINSNVVNWWASSSFGNRFYLNCLPVFFIFFMQLYRHKKKLTLVLSAVFGLHSLYLFLLQAEGLLHLHSYLTPIEFAGLYFSELPRLPVMLFRVLFHPSSEVTTNLALSLLIAGVSLSVFFLFRKVIDQEFEAKRFVIKLGSYFLGVALLVNLLVGVAAVTTDEKSEPYRDQMAGMSYHVSDWIRFIKKNSYEIIVKKYIKDGEYDSAAAKLDRLIKLNPPGEMYHLMLGLMHVKMRQYNKAGLVLDRAALVFPHNKEIAKYRRLLSTKSEQQDINLRFSFDQHFNMRISVTP